MNGGSRWGTRCTHHFKSICLDAEVRVVLVALDHAGLDSSSPALDEHLRPIHREQLHFLHLSDSPEENLRRGPAELSLQGPGRSQHGRSTSCLGTTVRSSRKGLSSNSRACLLPIPQFPLCNTPVPFSPKDQLSPSLRLPPLGIYSALAGCWQEPGRSG